MENISFYLRRCIDEKIFPGCAVGVYSGGRSEIIAEGNLTYERTSPEVTEHTVYDVASITKSLPTACCALRLIEEGTIGLHSRLIDFVPEYEGAFRGAITIAHLLTHTLDFGFRLSEKKDLPPEGVLRSIFTAPLNSPPGSVFSYANATSVLLGLTIERAAGMTLDRVAHKMFFGPLGMKLTTFFPERLKGATIAPTEKDPWRGRVIRGEVHDESAWALRPVLVAGSAGLFTTVSDLMRFCAVLLQGGASERGRIFKQGTLRMMHTDALPRGFGVKTGLGWELDRPEFMGRHCSAVAFGKTGFTGCVMVSDPLRGAGFVMLANHTFPRRRDGRDAINAVRCRLADMVFGRGYNKTGP